ncbi:hypothetical protein ACROYT_G042266 [Oculina patagonica]
MSDIFVSIMAINRILHLVFIATLDLARIFLYVRILMLLRCSKDPFKDKMKNTFLERCSFLANGHVTIQVFVLFSDAVEWSTGFDIQIQPQEPCNVLRALSNSMLFLEACNITSFLIFYSDYRNLLVTSKLKIIGYANMFLGSSGFAMMMYYSCLTQEFLFLLFHIACTVACVCCDRAVCYFPVCASEEEYSCPTGEHNIKSFDESKERLQRRKETGVLHDYVVNVLDSRFELRMW